MQRPCAYCKISGHHIRDCEERKASEERKRNSITATAKPITETQDWHTVRKTATSNNYVPPPLRKVETVKNSFANLYSSSDDELEEGEIAEDRPYRAPAVSDTESETESECSFTPEPEPAKWNRSSIKVVIPTVQSQGSESDSDEGECECDYVKLAEGLAFISAYVARYKGMKWEDIESDEDV
jgi:hypothetical protein